MDGGWIHVHLYYFGLLGELVQAAGDPVVEAGPHGHQEIRLLDGLVGLVEAVHAQHAQKQRVGAGETAQAHEGIGDRQVQALGQGQELFRGPAHGDPAAGVENRAAGRQEKLRGLGHLLGVGFQVGLVGLEADLARRIPEFGPAGDDVFGQIHQHGPGPAGLGHVKGLLDQAGQGFGVPGQVVVLGYGPGDADYVHFLKGVVADHHAGHLA